MKSKSISSTKKNDKFNKLYEFLDTIKACFEDTPPLKMSMRFGNTAFKDFHNKVSAVSLKLIEDMLPENVKGAAIELNVYILDSIGSNIRLDYGTGHELAFCVFLLCLYKVGYFT